MFLYLLPTWLFVFSPLLLALAQFGFKGIIYYVAYQVVVVLSGVILGYGYIPIPIQKIIFYTSFVPLMFLTGVSCCAPNKANELGGAPKGPELAEFWSGPAIR